MPRLLMLLAVAVMAWPVWGQEPAEQTATLITLDVVDAGPQVVVPKLIEQTGDGLKVWPEELWQHRNDWPTATFEFEQEPFWIVMREVCNAYGLSVRDMGMHEGAITVMQGDDGLFKAPFVLDGPFMMVLRNVHHSRSVDMAHEGRVNRSSSVILQVMIEPKVQVIGRAWSPTMEAALDENGASLLPERRPPDHSMSGAERVFQVQVPLHERAAEAKKLTLLKGTIQLTVRSAAQTLTVDDILNARNSAHDVGNLQVTVQEMTGGDRQYELKVLCKGPGAMREQMQRWNDNLRTLRVLDSEGRPLSSGRYSGGGAEGGMQYTITLHQPTDVGPPAKLVWEITTGTQELAIPFEFRDVPLN